MRICRDPVIARRSERFELGLELIVLGEELFGTIGKQPFLEQIEVLGLVHRDGHLVRTVAAFDVLAVDDLGARPALGRAQNDHGPYGALGIALFAGLALDLLDLFDALVERFRHLLVHCHGLVAFDKVRLPAAAVEEAPHLILGDTGEHRRVVDLEAVEVHDGQHRTVRNGVEELVGVPSRRKRAGLRLAVADDGGCDEAGVIEHGAECVRERITELTAFVDGAGRLGRDVGRNAAREGELLAQSRHALFIFGNVGVNFAVGAFQIGIGDEEVTAVAGAGKKDEVEIKLLDDAVEVDIDEVLPGNGTPVADDLLLHLIARQRFPEEGVLKHVELCRREVVGRAPVSIHFLKILIRQGFLFGTIVVAHEKTPPDIA